MSVKLMSKAWDMDLPMTSKMLLLALCDHANDDGICYPSQAKLAKKCSMGARAVIKHIKWLVDSGILTKERRQSTSKRQSDLYHINLDSYCVPEQYAPEQCAPARYAPARKASVPAQYAGSEPEQCAGSYIEEPSVINHQYEPSDIGDGGKPAAIESNFALTETKSSEKPKPKKSTEPNPDNVQTWRAYAKAYQDRYGVLPVSNAKTRGQIAQFVRLVGKDIAPQLAAYYVTHNNSFFVSRRHDIGLLLTSYQQVLTDMHRGEQMTQVKARQTENTQSNFDTMSRVLAAREAQRKQGGEK